MRRKKIENFRSNIELVDFVAQARFLNPYPTSKGPWDYGIMFRLKLNVFHLVGLSSDGTWQHILRRAEGADAKFLDEGAVDIENDSSGSNHIRLAVAGGLGLLYVNGLFVSDLDFSEFQFEPGEIRAIIGWHRGYEIEGETTKFENFSIWEIK